MKKKLFILLFLLLVFPFSKTKAIDVNYSAHVQLRGWMSTVKNSSMSGTTGLSLRVEAVKINIDNTDLEGSIEYSTHVQNRGWMAWKKDGEISGTTGLSLRVEALQIKLIPKDGLSLVYKSHSSNGWQNYASNGEISGTTGQSLSLDQIEFELENNTEFNGDILYNVYNSNGWSNDMPNKQVAGIENRALEAIKINLSGELAENYNVFYRVHASGIGWMGWTCNGSIAGTVGYFNNIEAIQVKILDKSDSSLSSSNNASRVGENNVTYSSHVQNIGWQSYAMQEEISGTTGKSLQIEALKIRLSSVLSGDILYKTYITKRGWGSEVNSDSISGTTGLSRSIEAIQIRLTGNISNYYDVYYRTHISNIGWLTWAKNGESSGCTNSSTKIEAIQIKLVRKDAPIVLDTSKPYVSGSWKNNNTNYYDYFGRKATGFYLIDGIKYFFNSEGKLYGKNVKKVIDVSSWQETINWDTIKNEEDVDEAIIRVGWGTSYNDACGLDSYFDRNINEVQRLGIPYGIYIYAYAETTSAAQKEADFVISKMKQYNMPKSTYVWYDAEIGSISRNTYNTVIPAFINRMKDSGYNNVGVYSGVRQLDTTNGNTNTSTIRSYPIWVSQYYTDLQYTGNYVGWQFASDEVVAGVNGNVDVSMFKK